MEAKLKHLEFIGAVINRLATNSFLFKGWAITVAAALIGAAAVENMWGLVAIALVATAMFWALDGYYLWLERSFVSLYSEVARKSELDIDFSMVIDKSNKWTAWFATCRRPHLCLFYGAMLGVEVAAIVLIGGC